MASQATTVGGTPRFSVSYTRDALGRIQQQAQTINGVTRTDAYSYDLAGRLTDVTRDGAPLVSYTYDANGNRLSETTIGRTTTSTYDMQDRLVTSGAATFTYTAAGELRTRTVGASTTTYTYDVLGNLTAVALPDGTLVSYVVDGANRRIGRLVNGVRVQGFLYQGQLRPVAELDGSGNIVSRFVYGTGINVPDHFVRGGVTYRIITDHLGSPRLVVNTSTGQIAQELDYDPFGRVVLDTNPGFQPFGFAGGLYDPLTGLVRFGLRDYDADTGRWTARDPIGFGGGDTNLFGFLLSDPINSSDPTGLCFGKNFSFAFHSTNAFFFSGYTRIARTLVGTLTAGAVARSTGLTSLGMAWRDLISGQGVANLGFRGTLTSLAVNSAVNAFLSTLALETGIVIGAALDAGVQTFVLQNCEACPR